MTHRFALAALTLLAVAFAGPTAAAATLAADTPSADASLEGSAGGTAKGLGRVHVESVLGNQSSETASRMGTLGVTVGCHYGLLEAHAVAEVGTQLFGTGAVSLGLLAGVGQDVGARWRVSALGEIGDRWYEGVGGELLGSPGVSLHTGYVGARLGAIYGAGDGARFTVGAWLFVRDDLTQTSKSVTYTELFGGTNTKEQRVGDVQVGAQLRLGFETGAF